MKYFDYDSFKDFTFISKLKALKNSDDIFCVTTTANIEDNKYDSNIHNVKKSRNFTNSNKDSSFFELNDGNLLINRNSDDEKDSDTSSFYRLPIDGGESVKEFDINLKNVEILFELEDSFILKYEFDRHNEMKKLTDEEVNKDVEVITELPYFENALGFTDKKRTRIARYFPSINKIDILTDEFSNISSVDINDDKSKLVFVRNSYENVMKIADELVEYDLKSGEENVILNGFMIMSVKYFNDDIVIVATDGKEHGLNQDCEIYKVVDNKAIKLNDEHYCMFNSIGCDLKYSSGSQIEKTDDYMYFVILEGYGSAILRMDNNYKFDKIFSTNNSINMISVKNDDVYYVLINENHGQEVYKLNKEQLTHLNNDYYHISKKDKFTFENDGNSFTGWVIYPKNYDENKTYPGILSVHGGPKTVFGEVLFHEMELLSAKGYFVFYTNPRGSDGYGNEFMDIRGKYGDVDYSDLMKFTDIVMDKYPIDKLGYTGGSYGGFMANWMMTHTDRFDCFVSQRSISNWISFSLISDIGYYFGTDQNHTETVLDDYDKLWDKSPLKYAKNAHTPTLFIHSTKDYRCPLSEGMQMFQALKLNNTQSRFVMFYGENHELSRSGKPKNRIRRLKEICDWFDIYLR
ncbi:S9 family peptidase [uncultured Finegoldia sp.]|uniref:alpha/beta hydrolase family protein n=1 Tax=uncultured Finegoldia sp. TaxID=328009 RepID=UPI0025EF9BF2|nr:S9 family peptidase [uncultured Finegoldia sp.]